VATDSFSLTPTHSRANGRAPKGKKEKREGGEERRGKGEGGDPGSFIRNFRYALSVLRPLLGSGGGKGGGKGKGVTRERRGKEKGGEGGKETRIPSLIFVSENRVSQPEPSLIQKSRRGGKKNKKKRDDAPEKI